MGDWVRVDTEQYSALYENGKLVMYSEGYLVDEFLFYKVLGGKSESSDAWYERVYGTGEWSMPETLEEYLSWSDTPGNHTDLTGTSQAY